MKSPVPGSCHAFAFSPLKSLFIRRRGGVTAVNGMFLHSEEERNSRFSVTPLSSHIPSSDTARCERQEKTFYNHGAVLDLNSEENAESHIQTHLASDLTVTFHTFLPTLYGFSLLGIGGCQKVRGCSAFCSQALREETKEQITTQWKP